MDRDCVEYTEAGYDVTIILNEVKNGQWSIHGGIVGKEKGQLGIHYFRPPLEPFESREEAEKWARLDASNFIRSRMI